MYAKAKADGVEFTLAHIAADFHVPHPAPFDNGYITALFKTGVKLGREGFPWAKMPPEVKTVGGR